jgi:hypothetical protein
MIYFDEYTRGTYGAIRTCDFVDFEDASEELTMPSGMRHGSVLEVPMEVIEKLLSCAVR